MKTLGIAAGALVCAATTSALAESVPPPENTPPPAGTPAAPTRDVGEMMTAPVRAPKNAFELGVSAGYTQGFGSSTMDPRVGAGPGGTVGISLADRIDPHWSAGVSGEYQAYSAGRLPANAATLRGGTADILGTYHFTPYNRLDPYVGFGAGYRLFARSPVANAPTVITHGIELGKVEVGLDVRPSESVAISPMIGADLNLFMWGAGTVAAPAMPVNRGVNTFVFAGVKGRFDVGGTRESKPGM